MKRQKTNHSWNVPACQIVYSINIEALKWQISQGLRELTTADWAILQADPTLEDDPANEVVFKIYSRVLDPIEVDATLEFDAKFTTAFEAELRHQLNCLLAVPLAA